MYNMNKSIIVVDNSLRCNQNSEIEFSKDQWIEKQIQPLQKSKSSKLKEFYHKYSKYLLYVNGTMPKLSEFLVQYPVLDFIEYNLRGAAQVMFMNNSLSGN